MPLNESQAGAAEWAHTTSVVEIDEDLVRMRNIQINLYGHEENLWLTSTLGRACTKASSTDAGFLDMDILRHDSR